MHSASHTVRHTPCNTYYAPYSKKASFCLKKINCVERQIILDSSSNDEVLLQNRQSEFKRADHLQI
jgi:hypothetical protein